MIYNIMTYPRPNPCASLAQPLSLHEKFMLTQWGRDKMASISQTAVSNAFIFLNENAWISIKISLKFFPGSQINNIPALGLLLSWGRPGDKPLSEPIMVRLPMHICVTRPNELTCINWYQSMFLLHLTHLKKYDPWVKFSGSGWWWCVGGGVGDLCMCVSKDWRNNGLITIKSKF